MSDIIKRLRDRKRLCLEGIRPLVMACEAAADEIIRLREHNAEMLAALEPFARMYSETEGDGYFARSIPASDLRNARAAIARSRRPAY